MTRKIKEDMFFNQNHIFLVKNMLAGILTQLNPGSCCSSSGPSLMRHVSVLLDLLRLPRLPQKQDSPQSGVEDVDSA